MGEAGRNSAEWIFMGHRMVALNITVFNVKVKIITLTPNLRKKEIDAEITKAKKISNLP